MLVRRESRRGKTRYSLVYFARPEDDVVLKRLESPVIPPLAEGDEEEEINAKDWILYGGC